MFKLSDKVWIVGGVLAEYGVRLDGLHGIVTSSRHDAPPGTFAVYVYWNQSPYHDRVEELPKWVNVPPQFLRLLEGDDGDDDTPSEPESKPEPKPKFKPKSQTGLRLVD